MHCACVENKDGTAILQACRLHDAWAKAKYAPSPVTTGQRMRDENTDATR